MGRAVWDESSDGESNSPSFRHPQTYQSLVELTPEFNSRDEVDTFIEEIKVGMGVLYEERDCAPFASRYH